MTLLTLQSPMMGPGKKKGGGGFSSLYGIGTLTDVLTGLVIDFEIMSKYCVWYLCSTTEDTDFRRICKLA
jgi:hypothetical protein